MPRYPDASPTVSSIRGSAFSRLAQKLREHRGEIYPLHVGDTWMEPAEGCRMQDLRVEDHPGMHRYTNPEGMPELIDAIAERTRRRTGASTERGNVLVAAGATGALGAAVGSVVSPGDDVLVLSPFWPLIDGIVRSFHGNPIPVPFIGRADSPESAVEIASSFLTPRTVALYLNTPN